MALIPASDWPDNFKVVRDNFSISPVRGFSSKLRYDLAKVPLLKNAITTDSTFTKSQYLGLLTDSYYGSFSEAYQLWTKVGASSSTSDGNGYYLRRGGNFTSTGGYEYFESYYDRVKNNNSKYELRRIGAIYRNQSQITAYKAELIGAKVDIALLQQYGFDWAHATYDPEWLLQKLGWPASMTLEQRAAAGLGAAGISFSFLGNPSKTGTGGGTGGRGGAGSSGSSTPGAATNPNPVTKIVTRMPVGYAGNLS